MQNGTMIEYTVAVMHSYECYDKRYINRKAATVINLLQWIFNEMKLFPKT